MSENTSNKLKFRKRKKKKKNAKPININNNQMDNDNHSEKPDKLNNVENDKKPDEDDEDDDLSFLHNLKQRNQLKFRSKDKGLVFEENNVFTNSGLENPDTFKHSASREFGESFATEKIQDDILKNQRDEWVEKEMKKKLLEQGRVLPKNEEKDENKSSNINATTFKEELYALPNKLSMSLNNTNQNEAGERWLAGMAEVELPIEYKLKNIKQTEDAKKKLLQPKAKHDKIFEIPRNYNQDFTTHHYDRVKHAELKRKMQENQQKISMQRDRKRRRLMGPEFFYNNNNTNI